MEERALRGYDNRPPAHILRYPGVITSEETDQSR